MTSDDYIPIIDLTDARRGDPIARRDVADRIDAVCRESGFLVVAGHGIDPDLIDRMHAVTLELFEQPGEWKDSFVGDPRLPGLRGFVRTPSYVSAGEEVATAADLCELFTMSRLGEPGVAAGAGLGDALDVWGTRNVWPDRPRGLRDTWLEYYSAMEAMAADLMRLFALGLGLDEHHFDATIDEHITNLTANYYSAIDREPLPDQYRKGPHSDWGSLTILFQDGVGGLEVVDRRTGGWIDVPVIAGTYVVNIGDLMARWTNDEWNSTKHRVRVPPAEMRSIERVSIPFFHHPNWSAVIECLPNCSSESNPPRHDPVTAGEYLRNKVEAVYG
ncbi:isopenicillin N synthase family dioxygenase [Ilumatobacter sp.]|uniref:isopenicillin N synthase family dioxygenase n=1 Tax=Ilumatobacter sp. TaxID=1967498 RepID=UPI003C5F11C9